MNEPVQQAEPANVFAGSPRARSTGAPAASTERDRMEAADFFMLRSPNLPLQTLSALASSGNGAESATHARSALAALLSRPEVLEAVRVASPTLAERVAEWQADPGNDKHRKTEQALMRYIGRMSSRSTPFGLFAAVSWGQAADETVLEPAPMAQYKRHTRLDFKHLFALANEIENDKEIAEHLVWRPNTSLYGLGGHYRYVESVAGATPADERQFRLSALDADETLMAVLEFTRPGVTLGALRQHLEQTLEVAAEEVAEYVAELVSGQVLVSDLAPPVTSDDALIALEQKLAANPAAAAAREKLAHIRNVLAQLDQSLVAPQAAHFQALADALAKGGKSAPLSNLVQVDTFKPGKFTLAKPVLEDLSKTLTILARVTCTQSHRLDEFKKAFYERFEEREVPLTLVLDAESGISFDAAASAGMPDILKGLGIGGGGGGQGGQGMQLTTWDMFMAQEVAAALADGKREVVIDEKKMEAVENWSTFALPEFGMTVLRMIDAASSIQGQPMWAVSGLASMFAPSWFGRFCHLDPGMKQAVQTFLQECEQAVPDDTVVAEIVHYPTDRVANVIARPAFSRYEIPYLANGSVPAENQIGIDDLTLSVRNNTLVLRSKKLNKRVIPRLSCAHNYDSPMNLGIYRLLGNMQFDGVPYMGFRLPALMDSFLYTPRVSFRNVVLTPARWTVQAQDIAALKKANFEDRQKQVAELREKHKWPRLLAYYEQDNVMPIDLDNPLLVDNLAELLPAWGDGRVFEWLGSFDTSVLQGPEGGFGHEIVLPLVRKVPAAQQEAQQKYEQERAAASQKPKPAPSAEVAHLPGSEWLYAKIYCGQSVADEILRDVIQPLVQGIRQDKLIDTWFFIRYTDPKHHLRLRFGGDPRVLHAEVLPRLRQALQRLVQDDMVHSFQLDVFRPETDRYGGEAAHALCGKLFEADSDAVVQLLSQALPLAEKADIARWFYACVATHRLLTAACPDDAKRLELVRSMSAGMRMIYPLSKQHDGLIGERFREHRRVLEPMLQDVAELPADARKALDILGERDGLWAPVLAQLRAMDEAKALQNSFTDIMRSVSHMSLNRMLRAMQNPQELLAYDFLERMYSSWAARAKAKTKPKAAAEQIPA
jgi:thiopeptide-type bacteriocin biosynthesis protein